MLLTIFRTKGTPVEEQRFRLGQLFEDCGRTDLLQRIDEMMIGA